MELTPVADIRRKLRAGREKIMLKIQENISLKDFTTFQIGGSARFFVRVKSVDELREAVEFAERHVPKLRIFVLGGGSNILVDDIGFDGLVIKNEIRGIEIGEVSEDGIVRVRVGAGENWDDFAGRCVAEGLAGLENLSYIPGTVGAAPVQNIGAYGVEVSACIESVKVFSLDLHFADSCFLASECGFEYRDSFFKKNSGKYIITHVIFRLTKVKAVKNFKTNIEYKDLKEYFSKKGVAVPSIAQVRDAVIEIRKEKLPDWKILGTVGSFFKNPIISKSKYETLLLQFPGMPSFPIDAISIKVPLAWILDHVCGFRGIVRGNTGVFKNQALVIVNNGGATSAEVKALAAEMADAVKEKTGIVIEPEVQYLI